MISQEENLGGGGPKGDIVLVHGLWMTPLSWEKWAQRYRDRGYNVITPTWPMFQGKTVEEIRTNPEIMKGVGVEEIFEHLKAELKKVKSLPIIMGHSFGGLFVQKLLNAGFGSCGVAINAAPTKGVLRLPLKTIQSAWPALKNPFDVNGIVDLTFEQFWKSFATGSPEAEVRGVYDRYYIPSPKRPLIQVALANLNPTAVNRVNYNSSFRPPLLFIGGEIDRLAPPSINKENRSHYHTMSTTDYKEFPGRSHLILAQKGWEEVADYALSWAEVQLVEKQSAYLS